LKTLQDKVNAGEYDVQLAREQVQLNLTQVHQLIADRCLSEVISGTATATTGIATG
jgi:hypothetical protein